jgi:putative Mg2+ transporter-C (MgtC) family protein
MPVLSLDLEALLRMGLAVLCGMAVGLNRAHHGDTPHPNRLRVHVLVGLSACLMVLAAGPDDQARSRAIQGVAAGVGFLGAGEILVPSRPSKQVPMEVRGLSSAASIWFTASLGVTVAASSPVLALVALVLALITLSDRHLLVQDNPENQNRGATPSGKRHQPSSEKPANHKGKNEADSEAEKPAERGGNSKHSRQR